MVVSEDEFVGDTVLVQGRNPPAGAEDIKPKR